MDIIELIDKQNALNDKLAEIMLNGSRSVEVAEEQKAPLRAEFDDLEKSIQVAAKEIVDNSELAYADESEAFADALNEAAEEGRPVEEVIFGADSFIDPTTANCTFALARVNGELRVMEGELTAQSKKYPWLVVRIVTDGVDGYAIWEKGENAFKRPALRNGIGCMYHTNGWLQWSMLSFFRRAYARQQRGLPLVEEK